MFKAIWNWLNSTGKRTVKTPVLVPYPCTFSMGTTHTATLVAETQTPTPKEVVKLEPPKKRLEVTCHIDKLSNKELSEGFNRSHNPEAQFDFMHFNLIKNETKDRVWIYSVSNMELTSVQHPLLSFVKFPKVKAGEDYTIVTSIPRIFRYTKDNAYTNEVDTVFIDGRRVAMDFVNPDNLGLNQKEAVRYTSSGRDLSEKGIFWSLKNPPSKLEVKQAKKRMETRYKRVIEQMDALECVLQTSEDADIRLYRCLQTQLRNSLTPEAHGAANYFNLERSWHRSYKKK
jgi:hypothetical protein